MPDADHPQLAQGSLIAPDIAELLEQRQTFEARSALLDLMDPEIADVLLALEPAQRAMAFRLLPRDRAATVFTFLPSELQEQLLAELNNKELAGLINEMAPDDRAELFDELPGQIAAKLLPLMAPEERRQTQAILGYPPESVGRLMTPDYVAIRPDWTVQQVLEHIRKHGRDAETLSRLYVVDDRGRLIDDIRLRQLLLVDPNTPVSELMTGQFHALNATDDREAAVSAMNRYDYPALPVIDRDGILVGIVTFDDVADVAEEETTEDIQKMGGVQALEEPYIDVPIWKLVRNRGTWLTVLFLGEMLTAWAMGHFEDDVIKRATSLAIFIPLIIASGGNSGSQASTLIIRSLSVGEITLRDWLRVFRRELACGALLGAFLGLIAIARVGLWGFAGWETHEGHYFLVGMTVAVSLLCVVLWGSLMGSMLPFILRWLRLDPAVISAPLVATLVDVTGLVIYFTTALLLLKGTLL